MLILVTGWRKHPSRDAVWKVLDDITAPLSDLQLVTVLHGAAPGADGHADAWCRMRGASAIPFPARDYGQWPGCGPRRNKVMVRTFAAHAEPTKRAVAFPQPGWETAERCGTRGCIALLREAGFEGTYLWCTPEEAVEHALSDGHLMYRGQLLCSDCWQPLKNVEHDYVTREAIAPECAICGGVPDASHPNVPMPGQSEIGVSS